jgi:hypothetical protein
MHLDLRDEETAALTQELHEIVENDRYSFSPRIRTLEGDRRQAQTGAGSRAFATAAEGLRAAIERHIPATWLERENREKV